MSAVAEARAADLTPLTWSQVEALALDCALRWMSRLADVDTVYGVPRGGVVPALLVAKKLGKRLVGSIERDSRTLVIDDLVDSGETWRRLDAEMFDALIRKPRSPAEAAPAATVYDGWVVFPWEEEDESEGPEGNVTRLLTYIGEDPNRDGLRSTPGRVVRAWREMTQGYSVDVAKLLETTFEESCDEMVVVEGIEFTSLCEHHVLPFTGVACVGYVPAERVVGLSKLARLVDAYAHRLQIQERMTAQIADAIEEHLSPRGTGVVVRAFHSCMGCRGVRKPSATMVTSALHGYMKDDPKARAEFLALARAHNGVH